MRSSSAAVDPTPISVVFGSRGNGFFSVDQSTEGPATRTTGKPRQNAAPTDSGRYGAFSEMAAFLAFAIFAIF